MAIYFLENTDWSSNDVAGRCFYQFPFAFFRASTEKHISLIDELKNCQFRELGDSWLLSFSYVDYNFFVDAHSHGCVTSFIVAQPDCPDEILLQIIGLFSEALRIAADYEPSHPNSVTSASVDFPGRYYRSRYSRAAMRTVSVAFASLGIYNFFNGNFESGAGFGAAAILVVVASFCSDFTPRNNY